MTNGDYIDEVDDDDDGGGGGSAGGKQGGNGGSGNKLGSFVSVITPLTYIPPTIAAPEYAKERACQFDPVLSCNPEDAVYGGENNGSVTMVGFLWAMGELSPEQTYGKTVRLRET
ncbi:hypothetical protein [Streptomyces vinaceus]|uniref:hypothetical protein n=1 Tax=Streptomyces vinaceus TaxID=1960 RepID=UPI0035E1E669